MDEQDDEPSMIPVLASAAILAGVTLIAVMAHRTPHRAFRRTLRQIRALPEHRPHTRQETR